MTQHLSAELFTIQASYARLAGSSCFCRPGGSDCSSFFACARGRNEGKSRRRSLTCPASRPAALATSAAHTSQRAPARAQALKSGRARASAEERPRSRSKSASERAKRTHLVGVAHAQRVQVLGAPNLELRQPRLLKNGHLRKGGRGARGGGREWPRARGEHARRSARRRAPSADGAAQRRGAPSSHLSAAQSAKSRAAP